MKSASFVWFAMLTIAIAPAFAQEIRILEDKPLSHIREGGTPYDPTQSLIPYSMNLTDGAGQRNLSSIASPAEYEPVKGVLYKYSTNAWPQVVTDLVAALTGDPAHDEIAYVVVTSNSQRNAAISDFTSAGADLDKVEFLIHPSESIWMRDYGPHFIREGETIAIVDSHYYPQRPRDNFIPTLVGDQNFGFPTRDMGLYYSGGNFQPGPNRSAFITALINLDNPGSQGFNPDMIEELYNQFQGIDTLHVLPQLPPNVDGTGHIDMWMYLIDEDTVIISEFLPGSNSTAIQVTNNAVPYMESLGFTVHRPKAWNSSGIHFTYANAFRVNNRIFVPAYGTIAAPGGNPAYNARDAEALAIWEAAAGPEIEIIPIQCSSIIPASGAIHCIVKQVPRYVQAGPAVNVTSPSSGDIWISGETQSIEWSAIDTDNADVESVDLYYSLNNGATWDFIANTVSTGSFDWTLPSANTSLAQIRVVANAVDGDISEFVTQPFTINPGAQIVYDFSSGANVDHFGFGTQTISWNANIAGDIQPVTDPISSSNLTRIATSNATGGDTDSNRYRSPAPANQRESTHVFEITINESISTIDEIELHWEGYADFCTQVEMYVWDDVQQDWGDADGLYGQNRYIDSWAGNADGYLDGKITGDIGRFVDGDGKLRVLIYAERIFDETFHDYFSVTVKQLAPVLLGDVNLDGSVDLLDVGPFVNLVSSGQFQAEADTNQDGQVNLLDVGPFIDLLAGE